MGLTRCLVFVPSQAEIGSPLTHIRGLQRQTANPSLFRIQLQNNDVDEYKKTQCSRLQDTFVLDTTGLCRSANRITWLEEH